MQQDLFGKSEPSVSKSTDMAVSSSSVKMSKLKADFQKVLLKNNQLKQKLILVENMVQYSFVKSQEFMPQLEIEYKKMLLEELKILDAGYHNRQYKFTQTRKELLSEIIFDKALHALNDLEMEEARVYFERFKPEGFDQEADMFKSMYEEQISREFGINIDIKDFENGNLSFEELHEKYGEQFEHASERMKSEEEEFHSKRKKTKKEIAREEKLKAEEKLLEGDIQKIFKELVLKLHPDKELDEALKLEKEELLKVVTKARDEDDIFEMLRIRILISENDAGFQELMLNDDAFGRLTKLVKQKNALIEREIAVMTYEIDGCKEIHTVLMDESKMKSRIDLVFLRKKKAMTDELEDLKKEIQAISKNNQSLNRYIDRYFDDDDDFDEFDLDAFNDILLRR